VTKETGNYAQLRVEGEDGLVVVPVSSRKPPIPEDTQEKWQKIVDLVAGIIHVPSGLITRFTQENLEVVAASLAPGNPYKRDDHDRLGIGMFCETVVGKRQALLVPDSRASEYWANNPHASLGMRTYMGVPIQWEDGELFGTFCMLGDKANSMDVSFLELLQQFREIIETDLRFLLLQSELKDRLGAKEMELHEIHHRIKNQFNLLISYIDLQVFSQSEGATREALKEIQHRLMAVSLIHEELQASVDGLPPSLDVYLARLCDFILKDLFREPASVEYSIEGITLAMEAEVSIAMILSELLTNSAKHASAGRPGDAAFGPLRISIRLGRDSDGSLSLVYHDDGVGLPASFDPQAAGTLGMRLIDALTRQMNGSMRAENDGGAKFSFSLRP
jgi:two-component sensor histidine kinase